MSGSSVFIGALGVVASDVMSVDRLLLKNFTTFEKVNLQLNGGLNVFIGENATGKSHAMKAMYAALRFEHDRHDRFGSSLSEVFLPDGSDLRRLVRRPPPRTSKKNAVIELRADGKSFRYEIDATTGDGTKQGALAKNGSALFVPTREALAMHEGFVSAVEERELSFDATYVDLAKALGAARLKDPSSNLGALQKKLQELLHGSVFLQSGRFYLKQRSLVLKKGSKPLAAWAKEGVEAHLMSEGQRKLGSIERLLTNGRLKKGSVFFWDEPEANLNPRLIAVVSELLIEMALSGIQVIVASHDYLLCERINLRAKKDTATFFSFSRGDNGAVDVEAATELDELTSNPIREEFLALYDLRRGL